MPIPSARTGLHLAAPVAVFVVLSSCALPPAPEPGVALRSSSVLSETQIANTYANTAYDVLARLHPSALRVSRGRFEPTVYLDGLRLGGVSELGRIPAIGLAQIRFLNASEAFGLYGSDQRIGGAIVITSKVGPRN